VQGGEQESAIVVFVVAGHPYGVPTTTTREVVAWRQPRPLPGAAPWIEGVINLRGEVIPVCDLAVALGVGERGALTLDTAIVIVEVRGEWVGLTVDQVRSVAAITSEDVVERAGITHPAMAGIVEIDEELLVLLDAAEAVGGAESLGDLLVGARDVEDPVALDDEPETGIERSAA
jgi:chemotaxis signal transduction protein